MTTDMFDIFGVDDSRETRSPYHRIGLPFNPFRETASDPKDDSGPFYTSHIEEQLQDIQKWIRAVHTQEERQPLSLTGNIGAGKTRILTHLQRRLSRMPAEQKIFAEIIALSDTGFTRPSVGGLLLTALERLPLPSAENVPQGVIPLVWAVIISENFSIDGHSLVPSALGLIHQATGKERTYRAQIFTRWLQRDNLSASEARALGLYRKIDWEGELLRYLAELLRISRDAGVVKTCFIFIDQLEDLFRPTFSELRRSRLLTDLRGLIDEIDAGTPIGLILSWTPDFSTTSSSMHLVESQFKSKYEALFSRMERRRVNLPLLRETDGIPFATKWIDALSTLDGYKQKDQPDISWLFATAWNQLRQDRKLLPGRGGSATPRDLLTALANAVDFYLNQIQNGSELPKRVSS